MLGVRGKWQVTGGRSCCGGVVRYQRKAKEKFLYTKIQRSRAKQSHVELSVVSPTLPDTGHRKNAVGIPLYPAGQQGGEKIAKFSFAFSLQPNPLQVCSSAPSVFDRNSLTKIPSANSHLSLGLHHFLAHILGLVLHHIMLLARRSQNTPLLIEILRPLVLRHPEYTVLQISASNCETQILNAKMQEVFVSA